MQIEKYNKTEDETKNTIECNPVKIFYDAITNCKPVLGLTPIKRGGIVYQVTFLMFLMIKTIYYHFQY